VSESRKFIYDQLTQGATGIEMPGPEAADVQSDDQASGESSDEYVSDHEYESWLAELPAVTRDQVVSDPEFAQSMWDSTHPEVEGDDEEGVADDGDYESDAFGPPVDASTVDPATAAYYAQVFASEAARGDPDAMEAATFWHAQAGQRERIEAVKAGDLHSYELSVTDEAQYLREHFADKVARARAARGETP
jgi:hypothetical protein